MNLLNVINVFTPSQVTGKSLLIKVLKSITDFERSIKLIPAHDELKRVYETYIEKRNDLAKDLAQKHCDEINESNKNVKDYEPLTTEIINEVPINKQPEFFKLLSEIERAKINPKKKLKFTKDEIKESKIDFEEILILKDFILDFEKDFC